MPDQYNELRPALARFASQMEATLRRHDYKRGWKTCADQYLMRRLLDEVAELYAALVDGGDVAGEAVDVANFCMMLADKREVEEPNA